MAAKNSLGERFENYRASKATLFWACVGAAVLTIVIGFNWGGWMTNGGAQEMVQQARRDLAATFCVQRFLNAADAGSQHAELMKASTWQRDDFIEDGGWATLPELKRPIAGVADLCAEKLSDIEVSASAAQSTTETPAETTVQ